MNKKLNRTTYLQALALYSMACKHYDQAKKFEEELGEILGYDDSYCGCISDSIWENQDFNKALIKEEFVLPKNV